MKAPKVRAMLSALDAVTVERMRQDEQWGEQNHPDGTGTYFDGMNARVARVGCEQAFERRLGTWRHILDKEVAEAYAATDPDRLAAELVQVAAVAVAWVEAIGRRTRPDAESPAGPLLTPEDSALLVTELRPERLGPTTCEAIADAIEGAVHVVDCDESAQSLAKLADQWRAEANR